MRQAVSTPSAPAAIGPYSQGIRAGSLLFVSGQVPIDPATGNIVEGDIAAQTHRVLRNIREILEAGGATLGHVVRTTVFLADMNDFAAMNEVYGRPEYFGADPPARSTVEVARLPRDVLVEIEVVALA